MALLACACGREAVSWSEISYSAPPRPRDESIRTKTSPPSGCPSPIHVARAGPATVAAWWRVRSDSSAELIVARSLDGGVSWNRLVVADSADRSVRGCARPAPAIAADSASGYIDIAYFMEPKSGSGIFFSHSMDGGKTFHAAVPVVFGEKPSSVGLATSGDRVAVAYEDPNSMEPAVGAALSRTMGHIFEYRAAISSDNERAMNPIVDLRGDTVKVWWSDHSPDPRISATRTAYREGMMDKSR